MTPLTHAERVAAAVPSDCKIVALLHDAIEDGSLPRPAAHHLATPHAEALLLVTRVPGSQQTYREYIRMIHDAATSIHPEMRAAGFIAREVKIADLRDNLYGRPEGPPPESLRRRYEKALAVLEAVV